MSQITTNFRTREFQCPCCGKQNIDKDLVKKLQILRALLGDRSITITSGYRCANRNKAVKGASNSTHMQNKAADIKVTGLTPFQVYYYADKVFADGGLGIYKAHIHIDVGAKRRWQELY